MYKFLISILLVFNSLILAKYEDNSPSKVTKNDLKTLENFESLLYEKTKINSFNCKQSVITNYINKNKAERFDYNRLLVDLVGRVNSSESIKNETTGTYANRDRASISLIAKYPLYDKKTELNIKKRRIKYKSEVISDVEKYCDLKNELRILQHEINLLNLKQIRSKAREDTGQIYLDDRIKLIEDIIKSKNKYTTAKIKYDSIKLKLINKVKKSAATGLKELL